MNWDWFWSVDAFTDMALRFMSGNWELVIAVAVAVVVVIGGELGARWTRKG